MNKKNSIVPSKETCKCGEKIFLDNDFFRVLFSIFILFLIFFVYASTQKLIKENNNGFKAESSQLKLINVSKSESVYVSPNVGEINFTSTVEEKTIEEALKKNNEKVANFVVFLKNSGIASGDIKTEAYEVYPRYEWTKTENSSTGVITEGKRTVAGYEVMQSTQVKIRDLTKVGSLIGSAAEIGINNIGNLNFVVEDSDVARAQAREKAINAAKAEAQTIANKLGVELDGINTYNESYSALDRSVKYDSMISSEKAPTSIETGKSKVEVIVNISFKIK